MFGRRGFYVGATMRFKHSRRTQRSGSTGMRRLVPAGPFPTCLRRPILFRLAGKEWGEKGRWLRFGACCGCSSGKHLFYSRYEHMDSPYGRFGTRRLLWCTKFVNSCDSISAVKTPFVQNLQGSTDSPEFCRGRCPHRPNERLRIRRGFS